MGIEMEEKEIRHELEKLRDSEKHYRLLLDESGDPTFSFYADGTYRYVNRAFAKGVGKPRDEIIGRKIWDLFEKDEADKRFAIVKKVFAGGKTVNYVSVTGDLRVARPLFEVVPARRSSKFLATHRWPEEAGSFVLGGVRRSSTGAGQIVLRVRSLRPPL